MDHIPSEILGHIFSYLLTEREKHRLRADRIDHALPVRLQSENTVEDGFRSWHQLLETDSIRNAVRHVKIETEPLDSEFQEGNDILFWPDSWLENGDWPEFTSAINRICDMPNVNSLTLRFSMYCYTVGSEAVLQEPTETRRKTLELVSEAMRDRESRPGTSTIRELVLSNLEDAPLPTDLTHNLFRNIDRLHMRFTYSFEDQESKVFSEYIQKTLLPSVAEQLVELTLVGWLWGGIPVEFNVRGLSFPRLKRLKLDNYIIIRQDQFDWVLELRSLVDLQLYNTMIATHSIVGGLSQECRDVNLNGWKKLPDLYKEMNDPNFDSTLNTLHFGEIRPGRYMSDLRWSNMFDRIRQHLPLLKNFTFEASDYEDCLEHYPDCPYKDCMDYRYCTWSDFWSTEWYKPKREHMWNASCFFDDNMPGTPVGLYERTEPADRLALETLMEVTRKRRDGK